MTYIKPQITPPSPLKVAILNGDLQRRIILAAFGSPRGKPARNTRHLTWRVGDRDACMRFCLAHFLNGYSHLMISPNLHDIWAMFFLILSCCERWIFL